MSNQPYRVHLSIASPTEIEHTARQLQAIREGFLTTGSLITCTPRSIILKSWQRCFSLQVNPARRAAPLAIAREAQLTHLREANELLLRAAHPVMNRLTDFLAHSGYVIVLSDARGCLLEVVGDTAIRRRLARIDFIPGGDWSEAAAGTNAIGTALADGHVVQLMAAEHYCDGWQDLTCTAAPIRHPFTGEIVGILDVTGDYRLIRSFLTNSLAAAALEVQQELRTLLAVLPQREQQQYYQPVHLHLPGSAHSPREIAMHNSTPLHSFGKDSADVLTVDDMRLRLDLQQRRTCDAERLATAAAAISASLDLDVTLEKVAEQTGRLLRLNDAAVFLFDENGEFAFSHIWSKRNTPCFEPLYDLRELLEQAEANTLIRERGEPLFIEDIHASTVLPAALFEQMGIHSLALLPLVTARGVIGFIAAFRPELYSWLVDDIRLGLAHATQSATAIENARLFGVLQQHNRRIEVLNAMAQLLTTLPDPNQHLDLILKRAAEIMGLDAGMILLLDPSAGGLDLVAHCGLNAAQPLDLYELPLRPLHEIACLVLAAEESLLLTGCDGQAAYDSLRATGFCNVMAVPLVSGSATLGVLLLGSQKPRQITEEDLALFTNIGQQLGLSLKNAQLLRSTSEMEALREADQLKSRFIAAVSHDLRSPLTAIRASVESLLDADRIQSAHQQEQLLYNIAGQAGRLGRLVDQLLDLSRIEAGVLSLDRDWTELPVLIADTITKFEELNHNCQIERDLAEDLPLHYVDPDRLIQVLWNLLENATKYGSPCSEIKVEARWSGTEVLIGVADRGPGIPVGEREKIFQHFYRLNRDQRSHTLGSGLGLAICRGIVEAHSGRIWVEDRAGGGSILRFALPLPPPDPIDVEMPDEHELVSTKTR